MKNIVKNTSAMMAVQGFFTTFALAFQKSSKTGKSYTASSLRILQDGNVAKVVGCSGAM